MALPAPSSAPLESFKSVPRLNARFACFANTLTMQMASFMTRAVGPYTRTTVERISKMIHGTGPSLQGPPSEGRGPAIGWRDRTERGIRATRAAVSSCPSQRIEDPLIWLPKAYFRLAVWTRTQSANCPSDTRPSASANISVTTSASVAWKSRPLVPRKVIVARKPMRLLPSRYG